MRAIRRFLVSLLGGLIGGPAALMIVLPVMLRSLGEKRPEPPTT